MKKVFKIFSPLLIIFVLVIIQDITLNDFLNNLYYDIAVDLVFGALLIIYFWKMNFVRFPMIVVLFFGSTKILLKSLNLLGYINLNPVTFFTNIYDYMLVTGFIFICVILLLRSKKKLTKILVPVLILLFVLSYPVIYNLINDLYESLQSQFITILIAIVYFPLSVFEILFPMILIAMLLYEEKNLVT